MKLLSIALFAATLWRDPGPITSLDMAGGPGGSAKAPRPPFTFVDEDKGGTSPKVTVKDARGVDWIVKFGDEVKSETFASRIVWAAGYYADADYFVREGQIEGVGELGRAKAFIEGGRFQNARFELKSDGPRNQHWKLTDSQFKDSRELAGLKVLFVLLSNWDVKPENLALVDSMYAVTDWGATMGRSAELSGRSKWDCVRYEADTKHLIEGVDNGFVVFEYQGKQGHEILRGIKVDDVRWLMQRLGKLSDAQIDAALKASGATPDEVACFGKAFRSRLGQLMTVGNATPESEGTVTIRREVKTTIKTSPSKGARQQ
jgi:hypothetical protein